MTTEKKRRYDFTVTSLLEAAGRSRSTVMAYRPKHTDHIVELQLVVAALNKLWKGTCSGKNWEEKLVDFFNGKRNLQPLEEDENREKGVAAGQLIDGEELTDEERGWIKKITKKWDGIKGELDGFDKFKDALNEILAI